ncbi:MAG TPA: glycine--tRNA ligase subunit beta [Candidatus Brocadiia bacterium]|nr:glycine--tRNA ligase subunit beta [Candidatus Brocadiales bacterium]
MPNLLFEIGTEEIPASYIEPALKQMEALLEDLLKKNRMGFKKIITAGTPRRLTIFAEDIPERQESVIQEIIGPSAKIAFDPSGRLTKAAVGFAKSQGVEVTALKTKETERGNYCVAVKTFEGQQASKLLPEILALIIKSINFPKTMKWKKGGIYFSRPIRALLALFGSEILNVTINGIRAGRTTQGHPFLSGRVIEIESADYEQYKLKLKEEKVIVDIAERRNILKNKVNELLSVYGSKLNDEELLEEVTNLVEYPYAIECSYDESFLSIPFEVIITAMKEHQRYFPVTDKNGKPLPKFIIVANRNEQSAEKVREGNQNVLNARLADAKFFWEEDKRTPLRDRVEDLKNVIFQEKLGSYYDRTLRIEQLSRFIAERLNFTKENIEMVDKAAHLCKADLLTNVVVEFPSLQGIMGREYAREDIRREVGILSVSAAAHTQAIYEHYYPRYSGDKLPESEAGMVLSLADKFDAVVGCFSVGLIPSGSQDPYALRRQVAGIIQIIEVNCLHLSIKETIEKSISMLPINHAVDNTIYNKVTDFFKDRIYHAHLEQGHYRYDIINAVMATGIDDVADMHERLMVIADLSKDPIWPTLVKLVERTYNIGKNADVGGDVDEKFLTEVQEQELWKTYLKHKDEILSLVKAKEYEKASRQYYNAFAQPVHIFFEKVFVNVEDKRIRSNRILLSKKINELFSKGIADLSKIVTEGQ